MSPAMPLKRSRHRMVISTKFQHPSSREIPRSKLQNPARKTRQLDVGAPGVSGAWMLVLGISFCSFCQRVDLAPRVARAKAVVNIHHGHAARATVQHGQQRRDAAETRERRDRGEY